jgi:hypothetical protein
MFGLVYLNEDCDPEESPWLQMLPWFHCKSRTNITTNIAFEDVYKNWDARMKASFSGPGKEFGNPFLEFNVKKGWGPLVAFLQRQTPPDDVPFPQINEAESLEAIDRVLTLICIIWPFVLAVVGLAGLWICEELMGLLRRLARNVCWGSAKRL